MIISNNFCNHEFESIGNTEIIDKYTQAEEFECLNCGISEFQYYEIEEEEDEN